MGDAAFKRLRLSFIVVAIVAAVLAVSLSRVRYLNEALRNRAMVDGTMIVTLRDLQKVAEHQADAYRRELLRRGLTEDDLRALLADDGPTRTPEGRR